MHVTDATQKNELDCSCDHVHCKNRQNLLWTRKFMRSFRWICEEELHAFRLS